MKTRHSPTKNNNYASSTMTVAPFRARFTRRPDSRQAGFTIVELMVATLVFSTILIVITYGVLSFTRAYYNGVTNSTTQDTARNIISTISQAVEFNGSGINVTPTS